MLTFYFDRERKLIEREFGGFQLDISVNLSSSSDTPSNDHESNRSNATHSEEGS